MHDNYLGKEKGPAGIQQEASSGHSAAFRDLHQDLTDCVCAVYHPH